MSIELALDLGAKMGFCIRNDKGEYETGMKDFNKRVGETKYTKLTHFLSWLRELHEEHTISALYYERVDFSYNTYAAQAHGALKGVLHKFAEENDIPIEGFSVTTVKKRLTDRGNATKHAMIYYAEWWLEKEINDDNEADAVGVMYAGRRGER